MAIVNPANLYGGGQGILRDDFVNFAANQKAKRRALDEASTQYFTKMMGDLNTEGARDVDKNYLSGQLNDLQNFWITNKSEIGKGGLAQIQFQKKINNFRQDVQTSKETKDDTRKLAELTLSKQMKPRLKDSHIVEKMNLPINDPNFRKPDGSRWGLNDFSAFAKPWTSKDEFALTKAAIGNFKPTYDPNTPEIDMGSSGKIIVTKRFKPEDIKAIGEAAVGIIKGNDSAEAHYEDLLEDPNMVEKSTKALQQIYGANFPDGSPVVANTPIKMVQGLILDKAISTKLEEDVVDKEEERKFREKLQRERLAQQKALAIMREKNINARAAERKKYNIKDVYGTVSSAPTQTLNLPMGITLKGKDITDLSLEDKEDLFGTQRTMLGTMGYKYTPIKYNNRMYVGVDANGRLVDKDMNVLDETQVLANTIKRTGKIEKPLGKGEVVPVIKGGGNTPSKGSMAEKMRLLSQKK